MTNAKTKQETGARLMFIERGDMGCPPANGLLVARGNTAGQSASSPNRNLVKIMQFRIRRELNSCLTQSSSWSSSAKAN